MLFLRQAWQKQQARNPEAGQLGLREAIREGAVLRVRMKAMTVAVILIGLLPLFIGTGAGSE